MRNGEKNAAHSVTSSENLILEERRNRVLALRTTGLTFEQIVEVIKKEYGEKLPREYSTALISNDLRVMLDRRDNDSLRFINDTRKIELDRLDALWMVAYNMALGGDIKAMNMCLRIMERRAKYLGMDAPDKVNVRDWRSEILDLIRSGKFTLEQVKNELGTEVYTRLLDTGNGGSTESRIIDVESRDSSEGEPD